MPEGGGPLRLQRIPITRIPRDRETFRPTGSALQLAKSYSQYLCRENKASSVELIRHSRRRLLPAYVIRGEEGFPPDAFEEMICSFGEYRLEK
jgi:hypothetical protein